MELQHLFSPIRVGRLTLRNRIFSTGHVPVMAKDGKPAEQLINYHVEKARGGVALTIISGSSSVALSSPATEWSMIANRDDSIIPAYQRIADAVHAHGALLMDQLTHMGRRSRSDTEGWLPLVAPSPVPEPYHREVPHELEEHQILEIAADFARAALRCRLGGLDGAEISAAHNHLIDQFWSPRTNHRTDRWGGSLDNRLRFAFLVLEEVRNVVGTDFCVGMRISADEFLDGGLTLDDTRGIAQRLAKSGYLDFLDIIGGSAENVVNLAAVVPSLFFPGQLYAYLAAAIKEVVDLPIFHAGKIVDPEAAERLLADGYIDVVGMTRAIIADPQLPNKAREGRLDDIRTCVGANYCVNRALLGKAITCIQNPVIGREAELAEWKPAAAQKHVVVVGGGPAGLEAARMAALRGHRVSLFERSARLGGHVPTLARAPAREALAGIIHWLERQCRKLGVDIRLDAAATPEQVLSLKPDAVIVATGSAPFRPPLPGFDQPHVVSAAEVLAGVAETGPRVAVIDDDGGEAAPAAAELLAGQGREVEIVTRLRYVGEEIGETTLPVIYQRLFQAGVVMSPHLAPVALREQTLVLRNVYSLEEESRDVDSVVLAMGSRADDGLYHALKGRVGELHLVGDAMAPRGIHQAILEGTRVGREV